MSVSATKDDPLGWAGATIDGRFAVERLVGEGGFGSVYRGVHLGLGVPVAIKCLRLPGALGEGDRESFLQDFRTEARLLHQLSRKTAAIVQALDVGAAISPRGVWTPYIVMEWLEGESLEDQILRRSRERLGRRSLQEAAAMLLPVAAALEVAHAERVAHLDVKPANVFLGKDGTTKLLDFGIAKILSSNETLASALTKSGSLGAFTPVYAAPEQFNRRHGAKGPWTDVFALALVLIETCSGEHALAGENPIQLYVASANDQYRPSLAAHGVKAPRAVEEVVARALDVDPHRRFPTAGAFGEALRRAMETAVSTATAVVASIAPRVSLLPVSVREVAASPTAHTARPASVSTTTTGLNRVCTVLFAELTETVDAGEQMDPEQLSALVERSMGLVHGCIEALGGTVERLVGDSVLAVFGLYGDTLGAPERAVYAALRMGPALSTATSQRRTRHALGVRVGIATGRVFAGAQHASTGMKLTVTGGPVKLAARLQQGAGAGGILVDRDTHRHVAGLFDTEPVERTTDQTHPTGSKAFRIRGVALDAHALNVTAARDFCGLATRFVGRTAEMETVAAAVETVVGERCARFVTLLGPAGVGRSRLLAEIADRREQSSWVVLAAQCSPLHTRVSYALAAQLLRSRFHIHDDDSPEVAGAKVRRGLFALRGLATLDSRSAGPGAAKLKPDDALHADEIVTQLLCLFGLGTGARDGPTGVAEEASRAKHRIAAAVASLVRWADRPISVLCDDIHWADEASLALLEDVCVRLRDTPLLVVATARPELLERRPLWGEGESWHDRVPVGPPLRRHLEEMTRDRLRHVPDLSPAAVKLLTDHADSSPLTLVETLHLLVDSGVIDASNRERWLIQDDRLGELALPTTVHGIVQARLDRLDEASRRVLGAASVVGRTFWDGIVVSLDADSGGNDARRILSELRDRGFVRARAGSTFPDEQEYVFAEAAIQRVAYDTLTRKDRARLHRIVAGWLGERTGTGAGEALVASHHERAGAFVDAVAAYRRAGGHASGLGQNAEALHCFERASVIDDWLSGDVELEESLADAFESLGEPEDARVMTWPDRVGLRVELGDVLRHMGRYDDAEARYREARARIVVTERRSEGGIARTSVPAWRARIDYRLATLDRLRGKTREVRELLDGALRDATEGGLEEERAEILALVASVDRREGRLDECRRACIEGLRVCRAIRRRTDRWRQAVAKLLNVMGSMFLDRGMLVRAERCYLEAARAVDEATTPHLASHALNNVAAVRYKRGDPSGALGCFEHVLRLADRGGDLFVRTTALANLGEVLLELQRIPEARDHLEEATRLGERIRAHLDLPDAYRNLARVLLCVPDLPAAIAAARRGLDLVGTSGAKVYIAAVLATVAEVCSAARAEDAPQQCRSQATELARDALATSKVASSPLPPTVLVALEGAAAAG